MNGNGVISFTRLLLIALMTSSLGFGVFAQVPTVSVKGRVLDQTRAPIAAARVTAVSDGVATAYSASTDEAGDFNLSLPPGTYSISVSAEGFRPSSQPLILKNDSPEFITTVLQVSGASDTVTIVGTDYLVSTIRTATKTLTAISATKPGQRGS